MTIAARMLKLPRQTEGAFMEQVARMAMLFRWRVAHFRAARTDKGWRTACQYDAKGFPDLVLLRDERIVVAELKRDGEKLTPAQEAWIRAFQATASETYVWRPEDWDEIESVLRVT